MRKILILDEKNYTEDMPMIERFVVRAIIRKNGLLAVQKSRFGEYKIPGGVVDKEETLQEALIREVREETGLLIKIESIKEIGEILEIRQDIFEKDKKFVSHSLHFSCEVEDKMVETCMTESEKQRGFHLDWEDIDTIIAMNERIMKENWKLRDVKFLKWWKEHSQE